jgi:NAD(P)H-flavin reductase
LKIVKPKFFSLGFFLYIYKVIKTNKMIKSVKEKNQALEIDLTGPQGNAYFLLGTAMNLARQLGLPVEAILEDMKSADYEHLVETFDKHFGEYVALYR